MVAPRPRGGRVHQVVIDDTGLTVATLAGFFGNRQSRPLLTIPRSQLIGVEYLPPSRWRGARCKVVYRDAKNAERTLTFKAVDEAVAVHNGCTALAAQVLRAVHADDRSAEPIVYEYTLEPLRTSVKLFLVPALIAVPIVALALLRYGVEGRSLEFTAFVGVFLVCAAMGATLIDTVRLHTAWPGWVKAVVAVLAIVGTLSIFSVTMVIVEGLG